MAKKKSQVEKFKQAAREIEADDSETRFDERLGRIAKQKPQGPGIEKPKPQK